jgi:hypothetical protein
VWEIKGLHRSALDSAPKPTPGTRRMGSASESRHSCIKNQERRMPFTLQPIKAAFKLVAYRSGTFA